MSDQSIPFGRRGALPPSAPAEPSPPPHIGAAAGGASGRSRWANAVLWRLCFYLVLTILAACGAVSLTLLLGLFMIVPGLIFMAAPYVWLYLPILDWPIAAWRTTGKPHLALVWLGIALIVPLGLPLIVNLSIDQTAMASLGMNTGHRIVGVQDRTLEEAAKAPPGPATTLALIGEAGCGEVCQALLWSGATDHVLANMGRKYSPDRSSVESANLYTVGQGGDCGGRETFQPRKNGYCILSRQIKNPTYDGRLSVRHEWSQRAIAPFGHAEGYTTGAYSLVAERCTDECREVLSRRGARGEHLAVPLSFHYTMNGIDSSFGLHLNRTRFEIGDANPAQVLKAAFGMDISGFHPRPGFNGDVEQGNPGRLTDQETRQRRRAAEDALATQKWAAMLVKAHTDCEARRQREMAENADREAYYQAHKNDAGLVSSTFTGDRSPERCDRS